MAKCAFVTLGCKVNQCETEGLAELMRRAGYTVVSEEEAADVYIVNTCCVTAEGERKSRQAVRRAAAMNPAAVVAVTGCAAQKEPEVFKNIPGVTVVAGNSRKQDLPEMISRALSGIFRDDMTREACYHELPDALSEKTRAFIKVQDGCNNFCAYCIIPYVRGRECSRKIENVLAQCEELAQNGFREVVLNGIHLSSYGKEWNYQPGLGELVTAVSAVEGIERVRLGSLEPQIVTPRFLDLVSAAEPFCHQYHLSLQSGCDTVLKRMNRHYTAEQYENAVKLIRERVPEAAISTDIITGFPGETEEEFEETLAFAEKIGFAWVHVFPYSVRPGTAAAKMDGQVDKQVKAERAHRLSALCEKKGREYRERFVGQTKTVLCETVGNGLVTGLTKEHLTVCVPCDARENDIINVKICGVTDEGLLGERI